jgi:hypothetical protein
MISPPPVDDAVASSNHVSKLLGSPIEIDFEKEAARRALRKGFMPRVVPSDDQYRYLWRYDSCLSDTEQTPTTGDVCARCISTGHSLECSELCRCYSTSMTLESSSQSVENERSVETTDIKSTASFVTPMSSQASRASHTGLTRTANNAAHEYSRKQTWINKSGGGWISRSNFYKDDGVPDVATVPSRVDEPLSKEANTCVNNASETVREKRSLERNNSCPTRNEARDKMMTPDPTFDVVSQAEYHVEKEKDVVRAPVGRPQENVITKQSQRRKRGALFRPTAKRANQRLKQTSLFQMFNTR